MSLRAVIASFIVTISVGFGCVSGAQSAPPRLTTVGFSGHIANTNLARSTAQNRAIEGLLKLLNPVQFTWRIGRFGQQLTLDVPPTAMEGVSTRLRALDDGQWMAIATLPNPPPMDALPTYFSKRFRASAAISHRDYAMAHKLAEARAVRRLLTKVFGSNIPYGVYEGELRLASLRVHRSGKKVSVTVEGYAVLDSSAELNLTDRHVVLLSAVEEYRALGTRGRLIQALDELGKKELKLRLPHPASRRFEEAARLAPKRRLYFHRMELKALQLWGSQSAYPRMRDLREALKEARHANNEVP